MNQILLQLAVIGGFGLAARVLSGAAEYERKMKKAPAYGRVKRADPATPWTRRD